MLDNVCSTTSESFQKTLKLKLLFECTHQSVQWNLEALSITGTSTSDNQRSWKWHIISSAWSITATPGHQNCSPPNSNTWAKSPATCLRLSSLPTWTGVIAFSWAGHGKHPEVWKNPRHKDTQHTHNPHFPLVITSPVVLPSVYHMPDPQSITCLQHILPWSSLFYLPHFVTHIHPHHLTQLSVLILSCCLYILVCTHPCNLAQLPSVFHLQQPSTTHCHSLTASFFPASTY